MKVLLLSNSPHAHMKYRIADALNLQEVPFIHFAYHHEPDEELLKGMDLVWMKYHPITQTDAYKAIELAHFYGKKVVIDVDDNMEAIEAPHPLAYLWSGDPADVYHHWTIVKQTPQLAKRYENFLKLSQEELFAIPAVNKARYRQCLREADLIVTSTPALQKVMEEFNDTYMYRNSYYQDDWQRNDRRINHHAEKWIVWWGGVSHLTDLQLVAKAMKNVLKRPNVKLVLVGFPEAKEAVFRDHPLEKIMTIPVKDVNDYLTYRHYIRSADVALAPLKPTEFNKCKSDVKVLEAFANKVPVVASPTVYNGIIHASGGGSIAVGDDKWERQVIWLLDNTALVRYNMGEKGYAYVDKERNLSIESCGLIERLKELTDEGK